MNLQALYSSKFNKFALYLRFSVRQQLNFSYKHDALYEVEYCDALPKFYL